MSREHTEVSVQGLSVTYDTGRRTVHALGPVSLDIARGEFVSVVGPSGCGKTTLARVIAGLLPPSAGDVVITSRETTAVVPVATVFQDYAIFPWKTVLENVRFGLVVNGVGAVQAARKARVWIERVGLTGFETAYPADLSGGMQQRVGIARAFAVEPDILILDEPFGSLDAQLREVLQEELLDLHQEIGCTVVLITHSLEEALVLSDRVAVLSARPGRLLTIADVPFARPRVSTVRQAPLFTEIRQDLWNTLRSQVEVGKAHSERDEIGG